jgi:hypothetical protein
MNTVRIPIFFLPLAGSAGGSVYVPPTICPCSACITAHAAAYVDCTGSARTNFFTGKWAASGLALNSFFSEGC